MSARDDLISSLTEHACCFSEEDAKRMVDAFAHELAEKQRVAAKTEFDRDVYIDELSMQFTGKVVDLIDPEVQRP
jgi:hypothetical protein